MAEFLGLFASGIAVTQLASSLTSSIISLKGYFDQIKDAPAKLIDLMAEVFQIVLIDSLQCQGAGSTESYCRSRHRA